MRAVVVMSQSIGGILTYETAKADPDGMAFKAYLDQLAALGTPFVTSAGNNGEQRPNIDLLPQVLEDEDTPIINVGAVDYQGKLWSGSQDGDQVTIYAAGFPSESQSKKDKTPILTGGTSLAAPAVAGLIATCTQSECTNYL